MGKTICRVYERGFNTPHFIESLLKHVAKTPEKVGKLYLEMLDAGVFPDYKKENIVKIVETPYKNREKESANIVCNRYGEEGIYFLREIYEKYKNA